eukprot:CAMPEP_0168510628 /NCGR_PEP_ID=MMETSP0405-20121227/1587_1 /TAXON_ID=498012 /ORGANISM="Trichosphaerium sp, Strain Am-I-7 wt" /LENGTH=87 /DNA_ID=CAMNT_0008528519 /DNA_START=305 /DNA_END=565 /DNA_ORIENTATION=+
MQIGWTTLQTSPGNYTASQDCPGDGCGDDEFSYAYDGRRIKTWHRGFKDGYEYGNAWTAGTVVGCAIDMDKGEISFYSDGKHMGVAW